MLHPLPSFILSRHGSKLQALRLLLRQLSTLLRVLAGEWWLAGDQLENLKASSGLQECKAQHAAAQAEAAAAQAAAQQQSEALRRELAGRPTQAEVAALRERVEALRLLVDSREEDGEPEQADGAAPSPPSASQGNLG